MDKQELIGQLNTIDNIHKYSIKGGTAMFNKDYPGLLNIVNENTAKIQTFSNNKKLIPKLVFLIKYNGDINMITHNGKLMIFDKNLHDFKISGINGTEKQWNICYDKLHRILDFYDKKETIKLLKNNYTTYYGKSGNRRLLKDDMKLYLSLYKHTSYLDNLDKNLTKFSMRLHILVNNIDIICHVHNRTKFWRLINGKFTINCGKCRPVYPSIEWFKYTYNDKWEKYYDDQRLTVKNNKTNSLQWFTLKHGETLGKEYYAKYVTKKMNNLCELKANKYSKISQDLFWNIHNRLLNKDSIYFFELNSEFVLQIPLKYNYENTVMILDFKQNNKIIEYNGNYWHSKEKDNIRYKILKEMGYDIMIVTSDDYNRNKKSEKIIEDCIKFLSC